MTKTYKINDLYKNKYKINDVYINDKYNNIVKKKMYTLN